MIPNANAHTLWLNGLIGAVLLSLAGVVVVRSIRIDTPTAIAFRLA